MNLEFSRQGGGNFQHFDKHMYIIKKYPNKRKAFSLIEILIVVFIMSVAFMAFYTVSTVGTKYIIESKNRLAAVALVNEKMEIARNLAYDQVGTVGGMVEGDIPQDEDVTANGRSYHVNISVNYIDDPLDGEYPTDTIQNDYKIVKVTVLWIDSNGQSQSVSSITRFVPPGLETSAGGSPLVINISGSDGNPVKQALVHITNNDVSPVINDTLETNDDGHILIPSAPVSAGGYHMTITKSGYEIIATADSSPSFTPEYSHASVMANSLNTYNYIQDKLTDLKIKSANYQGNPVGGINFSIGGGRVIGKDASSADVFSMTTSIDTTGASSGEKDYNDINPGNYTISMEPDAQYKFIDFEPSQSPAVLSPGVASTYIIRVAPKNVNALFIKIIDVAGNPIAGATAKLTDISGGMDIFSGKTSSLRGVIFYPDGATPLVSGNYTLVIEAIGFETETKSVTIIDGDITEENIQLTAST